MLAKHKGHQSVTPADINKKNTPNLPRFENIKLKENESLESENQRLPNQLNLRMKIPQDLDKLKPLEEYTIRRGVQCKLVEGIFRCSASISVDCAPGFHSWQISAQT